MTSGFVAQPGCQSIAVMGNQQHLVVNQWQLLFTPVVGNNRRLSPTGVGE